MSLCFPEVIMEIDLQKAGLWKRFAAWMFDTILVAVIAVGIAFVFSALSGYDKYSAQVSEAYEKYEIQYSVDFDISTEAYEALSSEEKAAYDSAYQALLADADAIHAYNMTVNLSVVAVSISVLLAVMLWEFALPLLFGSGQTLGKKIFGLCLMRTDCVKINVLQLLVRTLLGKFTVEIMIPIYAVMMLLFGTLNMFMLVVTVGLFIAQAVCLIVTYTNSPIHDLIAGTAVVEAASQMIFETPEELLEFKKKQHAERVNGQD